MKRTPRTIKLIALCACLALSVLVVACEPTDSSDMTEEMGTVEAELFTIGVPTNTSPLEEPEMAPDAGFCLYTCEEDRATDTIGNCYMGTGCDRITCDGLANGKHQVACVDLPEAPEVPVTTYNIDPPDGRCGYLCEEGIVVDAVGACGVGFGCSRSACNDASNGVHYEACIQIEKATTGKEGLEPLKPLSIATCAVLCEDGLTIDTAAWCEAGTQCAPDACRFETDGILDTRCVEIDETDAAEEVEENETPAYFELEVGECGYRCNNGEIIEYRSNCLEGMGCVAEACEGQEATMVIGECL